jgi:type VI secretion system secreted protein Hcp
MAVETFLKIDGIAGEVLAEGHEGAMAVLHWSWGLGQSGTLHTAPSGRASAGKVAVDDLTIVKPLDKASPTLILACAQGRHLSKATLTCRQSGDDEPGTFWVMELTDVMVRTIEIGTGDQPNERPTETLTLNFAQFKVSYTPQGGDGKAQDRVESGWNIQKNEKV